MERFVCIHGHFYQPPRENPWLEAIEQQDSAAPFHDWNERITDECYHPNAFSRMLDDEGWITGIQNNYASISFNFGPTLLSWLQEHAPDTYAAIIEADRASRERFAGHGSAMAQAYNHSILPLCNDRDRHTQVVWGVRDFRHRFGREPEGMWLPETAADIPSLEALAEQGIRFTILAPRQAKRFRPIGTDEWTECADEGIDPSRPYVVNLPSGREIVVFFYDGPVSQAVAFERLLNDGRHFAARLTDAFNPNRDGAQLAHIATDGESYGHHHKHGDMALAVAVHEIEQRDDLQLTIYARLLEEHPPDHEAEIHENSSWSCAHGVERWRSDCGCAADPGRPWNQKWREPLRKALDDLRDAILPPFEREAARLLNDPWKARDDYIDVIFDRSERAIDAWLDAHSPRALNDDERVRALKLMELQRHAMLMYTSCGWFFDEISGIETVQVMRYAARAIQLAHDLFDQDLEEIFLRGLEKAKSNIPEAVNGRVVYEQQVRPTMIDLARVGAHYAVSSLFDTETTHTDVYAYAAESLEHIRKRAGRAHFVAGRAKLTSKITRESRVITYAVLHAGDHIINGGAQLVDKPEAFRERAAEAVESFENGDLAGLIHAIEAGFGESSFSLGSLFHDEQRRIAEAICENAIERIENMYRSAHEGHQPLIRYISGLGIPVPRALLIPVQFIVNHDTYAELTSDEPDLDRIAELLETAKKESVPLDTEQIAFGFEHLLAALSDRILEEPNDPGCLDPLVRSVRLAITCPFEVELSPAQNAVWRLLTDPPRELDQTARPKLTELATLLRVRNGPTG